jgi:hypothetical protein
MNVGKYISVKFFKIRRRLIGSYGDDDFAAAVFVSIFDTFYYWGAVVFIDIFLDDILIGENFWAYLIITFIGLILIVHYRKVTLCNNNSFEKVIDEVETEPRKVKWAILSIIYIVSSIAFLLLSLYCLVKIFH